MKIPTEMRTYCPHCNSATDHKVSQERVRQRKGGQTKGARRKERHDRGHGNKGRYSKRAVGQRNMTSKTSRKADLRLTCKNCGKKQSRSTPRSKKFEMLRK